MYHVPKSILVSNLLVNKTYQPLMAGILHGERWDWRKQVRLKQTAMSAETTEVSNPGQAETMCNNSFKKALFESVAKELEPRWKQPGHKDQQRERPWNGNDLEH